LSEDKLDTKNLCPTPPWREQPIHISALQTALPLGNGFSFANTVSKEHEPKCAKCSTRQNTALTIIQSHNHSPGCEVSILPLYFSEVAQQLEEQLNSAMNNRVIQLIADY